MKSLKNVKGMRDFLPQDLTKKRIVENKVRQCFKLYGYEEVETPVIESLELITAKAGNEIRYRLYSFKDLGGREVALRPDLTPSIARLTVNKLRFRAKPLRLGYVANCFRYDNPQMGRYREFWQAGFELIGSSKMAADAEIITIAHDLLKRLGLKDFYLKIGHVGILRNIFRSEGLSESDQNTLLSLVDKRRLNDIKALLNRLNFSRDSLTIVQNLLALKGTNQAKVLASGRRILGQNDGALEALHNLERIIALSDTGRLDSHILIDLGFARGLEYYTGMIFELFIPDLKIALGGGGRYDKLVELFGGEPTPAVGFCPGIDRIILAMEKNKLFDREEFDVDKVLVIPVEEKHILKTLEVAATLRVHGISAQSEILGRSVSSALSYANKMNYLFSVLIGSRELEQQCVTMRNMKLKEQKLVPLSTLPEEIKKICVNKSNVHLSS